MSFLGHLWDHRTKKVRTWRSICYIHLDYIPLPQALIKIHNVKSLLKIVTQLYIHMHTSSSCGPVTVRLWHALDVMEALKKRRGGSPSRGPSIWYRLTLFGGFCQYCFEVWAVYAHGFPIPNCQLVFVLKSIELWEVLVGFRYCGSKFLLIICKRMGGSCLCHRQHKMITGNWKFWAEFAATLSEIILRINWKVPLSQLLLGDSLQRGLDLSWSSD